MIEIKKDGRPVETIFGRFNYRESTVKRMYEAGFVIYKDGKRLKLKEALKEADNEGK